MAPATPHDPTEEEELTGRAIAAAKHWGEPPAIQSGQLAKAVAELQAELIGLATDMRRGPLGRVLAEATSYLGELRREFLRVHRRLVVGIRTPDAEHALDTFRTELAQLNDRLRSVVLGRASRLSADGWRPRALIVALDRTTEVLPTRIEADLEPLSLQSKAADPILLAVQRAFVRGWVRLRRALGAYPRREVELQALARFHLSGMAVERIEGLAALFVQAEVQLSGHSRLILDGITQGMDTVRQHAGEDDFEDVLATFKQQVEEEFTLAERELRRLVDDGGRRAAKILGEALCGLKADLPIAGTFELPSRKRRTERVLSAQSIALDDLERRLHRARESVAAGYVLLGMHLEYASYRARVRVVLGRSLSELKKDVRGRSYTQIERVLAELTDALQSLEAPEAGSEEDPEAEEAPKEDLRTVLDPLERVLGDALRNANQLLSQLSEEQLVAPLLEALNREAQGLTDRYEVPAGRMPHAEWRLPPPLATVEVRLSELLTAYIQTDIAPELLSVTQAAVGVVQPVVAAFHELERVVSYDPERFAPEVELFEPGDEASDPRGVIVAALARSRAALEDALGQSEPWPEELAERLKEVVFTSVDALRDSLSEARVGEVRSGKSRGVGAPQAITEQVDRLTGVLNRFGEQSTATVRRFVGERRLRLWRRQLGLPSVEVFAEDAEARLAPPSPQCEIPLFYRRLFAANAYWAGDLLEEQRRSVETIRRVMGRRPGAGLRTAAVLSTDGTGQGALLAAISRGDRVSPARRVSLTRPVSLPEVEALFVELGQGQQIVLSGFRWLLDAKPGGFAPLRAFLQGVLADGGKNAWVIEAPTLVWRYACQVAPVDDVFTAQVHVQPLALEDLEASLWSRHQLSGLTARFSDDAEDSGAEASARERFFAELHDVSGGLLSQALPTWIASITEVSDSSKVVRLGRPPSGALPALERLDEQTSVLLLAILRQGWMDADTLAYQFQVERVTAQGRLMRLVAERLLEQKSSGLFQVRRHLRHGVQEVLRRKGWCP